MSTESLDPNALHSQCKGPREIDLLSRGESEETSLF